MQLVLAPKVTLKGHCLEISTITKKQKHAIEHCVISDKRK